MYVFLFRMEEGERLREQPFDDRSPRASRGFVCACSTPHPNRGGAHFGHRLREAGIERNLASLFGAVREVDASVRAAGFTGHGLELQAVFAVQQARFDLQRELELLWKVHRVANRLGIVCWQRAVERRGGESMNSM